MSYYFRKGKPHLAKVYEAIDCEAQPVPSGDLALLMQTGLTWEEFKQLEKKQDGKCRICKNPPNPSKNPNEARLHVDHDHKTNEIRGLLCARCNTLLGWAKDDIDLLESAAKYLKVSKLVKMKVTSTEKRSTPRYQRSNHPDAHPTIADAASSSKR